MFYTITCICLQLLDTVWRECFLLMIMYPCNLHSFSLPVASDFPPTQTMPPATRPQQQRVGACLLSCADGNGRLSRSPQTSREVRPLLNSLPPAIYQPWRRRGSKLLQYLPSYLGGVTVLLLRMPSSVIAWIHKNSFIVLSNFISAKETKFKSEENILP